MYTSINNVEIGVSLSFSIDYDGTAQEIAKLYSAARRIIEEPDVRIMAEEWTLDSSHDGSAIYLTMTADCLHYEADEKIAKDSVATELAYFKSIVKRIEEESGVVFEEE